MIPMQILTQTADVTTTLAPLTLFVTLAAILCGVVLVGLGYEARRADPDGVPVPRTSGTDQPAPSPLGLRVPERFSRAA